MAVGSLRYLGGLALLMVAGVLISSNGNGRVLAQSCTGDIVNLGFQCQKYVMKDGPKFEPSPECCNVIKNANMPCVCKSVIPPIENLISLEKVVYVAQSCGRPLPHGMKCGSFTVPMA